MDRGRHLPIPSSAYDRHSRTLAFGATGYFAPIPFTYTSCSRDLKLLLNLKSETSDSATLKLRVDEHQKLRAAQIVPLKNPGAARQPRHRHENGFWRIVKSSGTLRWRDSGTSNRVRRGLCACGCADSSSVSSSSVHVQHRCRLFTPRAPQEDARVLSGSIKWGMARLRPRRVGPRVRAGVLGWGPHSVGRPRARSR